MARDKPLVKKSVVLQPLLDEWVRKTWALLIDQGHDANYSTALNLMLCAAAAEGAKSGGFSPQAIEALRTFLATQDLPRRPDLEEYLANFRNFQSGETART